MDIFSEIKSLIEATILDLISEGAMPGNAAGHNFSVERPKNNDHGEISTNASLIVAGKSKSSPRKIAELLAEKLRDQERIESVSIAGPGFINLVLTPDYWQSIIGDIINLANEYGRKDIGKGQKVNLEFVSANPTGPLHVGHARGAVYGDALGRLLEFSGYDVTREYYVNDGGAQVDTLARSTYLRYLQANGMEISFGPDSYQGNYLVDIGEKLKDKFGNRFVDKPEMAWLETFRQFSISEMLKLIKNDLLSLNVVMDQYIHEKSIVETARIDEAIEQLREKELIYWGVLEPPKGKMPDNWEAREQMLLKSTAYGDDVDRPIKKSDGSWTYFAPDIAYHYDKVSRGYDELINVFGADHGGYVKRLTAVVDALSGSKVSFVIKLIQMVNVISEDQVLKMSKRAGNFVLLREAIDAVGSDVTRFVMLMRKNDANLDFNFDKVREQSRDNPVFYVQYAHARICSLLKRAKESGMDTRDQALLDFDGKHLREPEHIFFIRKLAEWPRIIEQATSHREPHRIIFYLIEVASGFHSFWSSGREKDSLRILQEGKPEMTLAGLALARSTGIIIGQGLEMMGVKPLTEM